MSSHHCLHCGAVPARKTYTYCSNQCQQDFQYARDRAACLERGTFDGRGVGFMRRVVLEQQGRVCAICRRRSWCGAPIPLELDHINGNPTDQRVLNLRLVCGNCAMQLPTYKSRNRGSGRHARRERYRRGRSY